MGELLDFLVRHGSELAVGATFVVLCGVLLQLVVRQPLHRRRTGELTMLVFFAWLALAVVPIRRGQQAAPAPAVTTTAARLAEPVRPSAVPAVAASLPGAPPVVPEPTTPYDWRRLLATLFCVGSGLALLRLMLGAVEVRRIVRGAVPAPDWFAPLVADLPGRPPRLRVVVTGRRCSPFCFGVARPTVVLPESVCRSDRKELVRAALLHEVAHLRNRDPRAQLLLALASPLLFWNPLFAVLRRLTRQAAELVADAAAATGADSKPAYVRALLGLAACGDTHVPRQALAVVGTPSDFYRRMHMLMTRDRSIATRSSRTQRLARGAFGVAVLMAATLSFGVTASAQGSPKPSSPPSKTALLMLRASYQTDAQLGGFIRRLGKAGHRVIGVEIGERERNSTLGLTLHVEDSKAAVADLNAISAKAGVTLVSLHKKARPRPQLAPRKSPLVRFNFVNEDIRKILDSISQIAGANLVISPDVRGTVTMRLRDVPWRSALGAAVKTLGFVVMEEADGILLVTSVTNAKELRERAARAKARAKPAPARGR